MLYFIFLLLTFEFTLIAVVWFFQPEELQMCSKPEVDRQ